MQSKLIKSCTLSIFQYTVEFERSLVLQRFWPWACLCGPMNINLSRNQQKNNIGKVKVVFKTFMKNFFSPVKPAVMKWFLFHFVFSRSKLRILPGLPTTTQLRRLRQLLSLVALFKPYWTRKKKSVVLIFYWWYFLALWYWIYFPKSYFLLKFLHFFNSSQRLRRSLLE